MIPRFFTHMDKQASRATFVVIAMFALVAFIALLGKASLNLGDNQYLRWFEYFKESNWAIPIVLLTFVIGAFIGVPQWAMIAGVVVAFGSFWGGMAAWASTMTSASLNFWIARWIGAERVEKYGGDLIGRIVSIVRRNGFVASMVVRWVPTGPFILVNMAAGVSGMRFTQFISGTGFGTIPKIVIVALITSGVVSNEQSDWIRMGLIGLAAVFILVMLLSRKYLRKFVRSEDEK